MRGRQLVYRPTADTIRPGNLNDGRVWKSGVSGARLHGRIAEGNQVVVDTRGVLRLTVWLAATRWTFPSR